MAEISDTMEPIVFEHSGIRFTVDRNNGIPLVEITREATEAKTQSAGRAVSNMLASCQFVPLTDAGFRWMVAEIRLAWSEDRVAELEAERNQILDMSADCEGNATDPVQAFGGLLTAFELACTGRAELSRELAKLKGSPPGFESVAKAWGGWIQDAADNKRQNLGSILEWLQGPVDQIIGLHNEIAELKDDRDRARTRLLEVRLSEAQIGSDYRHLQRHVRFGHVPDNPEQYSIVDGEIRRTDSEDDQ